MSYAEKRTDVAVPTRENYAPCRKCYGSTPLAMLAQYGAFCHTCFEAYCREGFKPPERMTQEKRRAIGTRLKAIYAEKAFTKDWAAKLREREGGGEHLTPAQKLAWRGVIGDQSEAA